MLFIIFYEQLPDSLFNLYRSGIRRQLVKGIAIEHKIVECITLKAGNFLNNISVIHQGKDLPVFFCMVSALSIY